MPFRGPQCASKAFVLYDNKTEKVFIHKAGEHDHADILDKLVKTAFNKDTRQFIQALLDKKTFIPKVIYDCLAEEHSKNPNIQVFSILSNINMRHFS